MASLCVPDDSDFVRRIGAICQWQSDYLADLQHWAGVLDRIHDILDGLLRRVPDLVVEGASSDGSQDRSFIDQKGAFAEP